VKEYIESADAPRGSGPYSPALRAGDFVFLSGQGPLHPETHEVLGADVAEQTRHTLANVRSLLEAAGASLDDVVRMNVYLADIADYDEFNRVYAEVLDSEPRPTRTTIGAQLVGILVEIDCVAHVGRGES
jgi:2-iminobutanoate/2-iminopropanoate deaminase